MNQSELIERLAKAEGITREAAELAVKLTFRSMAKALVRDGGRVEIRGLGTFHVKAYEGYQGRNPRTGEFVVVKSKRLPLFRMGRELKSRVNGEPSPLEREEANPKASRSQRQRHATQASRSLVHSAGVHR